MPTKAKVKASRISKLAICQGRAPTERNIAISRRRACRRGKIAVSIPIRPVNTTNSDTTKSAFSAVPIKLQSSCNATPGKIASNGSLRHWLISRCTAKRSEEHTSELQSRENLVCRLLLEKKKNRTKGPHTQRP